VLSSGNWPAGFDAGIPYNIDIYRAMLYKLTFSIRAALYIQGELL
jgi:hypothetical protein